MKDYSTTRLSLRKKIVFSIIVVAFFLFCFELVSWIIIKPVNLGAEKDLLKTTSQDSKARILVPRLKENVLGNLDDGGFRTVDDLTTSEAVEHFKDIVSDLRQLHYIDDNKDDPERKIRYLDPRFKYKTLEVNENGFRGPKWNDIKPKNEIRIFITGGSTAFSFCLDEEHSIHRMLETQLNHKISLAGRHFRVYCAAMPGIRTQTELSMIKKFLINAHPDFVVAINGYNDQHSVKNRADNIDAVLVFLRDLQKWPVVSSLVFTRFMAAGIGKYAAQFKYYRDSVPADELADSYMANILEMQRLLAAVDAKLLVYFQPNAIAPGLGKPLNEAEKTIWWHSVRPGASLKFLRSGYIVYARTDSAQTSYPLMLKRLAESGVPFMDGHSANRPDLDPKRTFFRDEAHLTPYGQEFLVKEVATLLINNGLLD